ncbi:MAG: branched-chain amino acid ABC transporter permease, partial [Phycisphaerae bacterium]|nr:branched-chain amino acid ABC transporter permease [Phycisphaerae bacterium]
LGAQRVSFPSLIHTVTYDMGGVFVTNKKIMIVVVSLLLATALHQFIRRTRYG